MHPRLRKLDELRPGWDGEDAPVIRTASLRHAAQIMEVRREPTRIVPTLTGGVQLEWETEDEYLEAEVEGEVAEWMSECDGQFLHWTTEMHG